MQLQRKQLQNSNKPMRRQEYKTGCMALKFCKFFRLSLVLHHSTCMLANMNHPSLCHCHHLLQFCLNMGLEATLDWGVYLSFHPVMCICEQIKHRSVLVTKKKCRRGFLPYPWSYSLQYLTSKSFKKSHTSE